MTTRKADVVLMKFGSHLYGLDNPMSDIDWKGIYLSTHDELLLGEGPHTIEYSTGPKNAKNSENDVDFEIMSLHKFIKHALMGETFAIDMLHCTSPENTSEIWEFLVANRKRFYSKHMKAYVGYVKSQAAKYGVKGSRLKDISSAIARLEQFDPTALIGEYQDEVYIGEEAKWVFKENPKAGTVDEFYEVNSKKYQSTNTVEYVIDRLRRVYDSYGHRARLAEENEGIDWKAVSHALRAGYQALHIYEDGDYSYPLPETAFLKAVKAGTLDYNTQVGPALEAVVARVEIVCETANLPDKVDVNFWKQWLVDLYRDRIYGEWHDEWMRL